MFKQKSIEFEEFVRKFSEIFVDTITNYTTYYDSSTKYAFVFNVDFLTAKSLKMIQNFATSLKLDLEVTAVSDSQNIAFVHIRFIHN
jgi:hypothetical protein